MVVLHKALDYYGQEHIGYIVKWENIFYIVSDNGLIFKVMQNTIVPINNHIEMPNHHSIEKYLRQTVGIAITKRLKDQGVYYLEDLCGWSDQEIMNVRGVGNKTLKKIKNVMISYDLV